MQASTTTFYQNNKKDIDVAKRVALPSVESATYKPFDRLLSQNKSTPTLFFELVNKLGKWFSISKATLSIYNNHTETLKVVSWWDINALKQGVLISLPTENSLFYKVIWSGELIHEQVKDCFSGNYIEQRLMTNKETSALAVCPLMSDRTVRGLISLSSPVSYAFEMLEKGYLSTVFERFASVLAERNTGEYREELFKTIYQDIISTKCSNNLKKFKNNSLNNIESTKSILKRGQ